MPRKRKAPAWTDDEFAAECKRRKVFALPYECEVSEYRATTFKVGEPGRRVVILDQTSKGETATVPED